MVTESSTEFKRLHKYLIVKISDTEKYLSEEQYDDLLALLDVIWRGRVKDGKAEIQAVVVESDWPEYEPVWKMIEDRVTSEQR